MSVIMSGKYLHNKCIILNKTLNLNKIKLKN